MSKAAQFLENILKDKTKLTNAAKGTDFEERIKAYLRKAGFYQVEVGEDEEIDKYLKEIKPTIQSKLGNTLIDNGLYKSNPGDLSHCNFYIPQPYGKQDFPDFLIFTEHKVITLEIKYSTQNNKRPMWNSNLPKKDSIYIFGVYAKQDLTIFRGEDILPETERKKILDVWDGIDKAYDIWENNFLQQIKDKDLKNEYGFSPYVRHAYEQGKKYNENAKLDYLAEDGRKAREQAAIQFIKDNDK